MICGNGREGEGYLTSGNSAAKLGMMYDMKTVAKAESREEEQRAGLAALSNLPVTRNADTGSVSSPPPQTTARPSVADKI